MMLNKYMAMISHFKISRAIPNGTAEMLHKMKVMDIVSVSITKKFRAQRVPHLKFSLSVRFIRNTVLQVHLRAR